jgi:D-arabinose 1-dehydrogenase-like Zn-dependent alcohol dehydrogenase
MNRLDHPDRRERYKARHKAEGLCRTCTELATHGVYCRKHWIMTKAVNVKYARKLRLDKSLCLKCGKKLNPEYDAPRMCQNCSEEKNMRPRRPNYR